MNLYYYLLSLFILLGNIFYQPIFAAMECSHQTQEIDIQKRSASAAMWDNLRNKPGSLRYELADLLADLEQRIQRASPPSALCRGDCRAPEQPIMVFQAAPTTFLEDSDYSDAPTCRALERKTKVHPLIFDHQEFAKMSEISEWFNDFSQGRKTDGTALYQQCPGLCSLRYVVLITQANTKYSVRAEVTCGAARDKQENRYWLQTAIRWRCQ